MGMKDLRHTQVQTHFLSRNAVKEEPSQVNSRKIGFPVISPPERIIIAHIYSSSIANVFQELVQRTMRSSANDGQCF